MRTTIDLDDDVKLAVDRLRAERGVGLSEAVNLLARAGLRPVQRMPYVPRSADLGLMVDVANVGEVLDLLDSR